MDAIQVTGLTKLYQVDKSGPLLRAVDGIEVDVREGEVFGFLGPNSVGKTTTIHILTGLSHPTAGRAAMMGLDLATDVTRINKRIGVVPETSNLYDELSAFDNLVLRCNCTGCRASYARYAPQNCWRAFDCARSAMRLLPNSRVE